MSLTPPNSRASAATLAQVLALGTAANAKITALTDGTAASDAAAFGQIPNGFNGQAGIMVPTATGWQIGAIGFTANRAVFSRFVLPKALTVTTMRFRTIGAGTGNVDAGIYDSAGNRLASAGSTAGKKGATTSQTIALTASVALTAGTVYYAALVTDTSDGTYAFADFTTAGVDVLFGATLGLAESFFTNASFPLPNPVALGTASGQVGPVMALVP